MTEAIDVTHSDISALPSDVLGSLARSERVERSVAGLLVEGLSDDVLALKTKVAQLHQAMDSRAPIEQAKGILMHRYGLGAEAAFDVLRRWSAASNVKLRLVAQTLVDVVVEGSPPDSADPAVLELIGTTASQPGGA